MTCFPFQYVQFWYKIVRRFKINRRSFKYQICHQNLTVFILFNFDAYLDKDSNGYFDWKSFHQIIQNRYFYLSDSEKNVWMSVASQLYVFVFSQISRLSIFVIIMIRANWNVRNLLYVKIAFCLNGFVFHFKDLTVVCPVLFYYICFPSV